MDSDGSLEFKTWNWKCEQNNRIEIKKNSKKGTGLPESQCVSDIKIR